VIIVVHHSVSLLFKQRPWKPRLANDRLQGTNAHFIMIGHWHGDCGALYLLLHDNMAPAVSDLHKPMIRENGTDLTA